MSSRFIFQSHGRTWRPFCCCRCSAFGRVGDDEADRRGRSAPELRQWVRFSSAAGVETGRTPVQSAFDHGDKLWTDRIRAPSWTSASAASGLEACPASRSESDDRTRR